MPKWFAWLILAIVAGVIYALSQFAKLVGWQVCLGFAAGCLFYLFAFRYHYGWWPDFNMDGEDAVNSQLPRIDPTLID